MRTIHPISVVLAVAVLFGCGGDTPTSPAAGDGLNLVVVLADTLRASHLSSYGYHRETSPRLDLLAAEGVLFERARSQAACTFPSVNSLLTSRYPARFLGQEGEFMGIPDDEPALAAILSDAGYATAAVSASPVVRATPAKHNPAGGYGRGFDTFDEHCLFRPGRCVTRTALELIDGIDRSFFLYLHYMDPHGPYAPPPEHERRWAGEYRGSHEFVAAGDPQPIANMVYNDGPALDLSAADIAHLVDLYDDEIAVFDAQLGALLDGLEARNLLESTVVVVLADHGEEFFEHGDHIEHCRVVYDASTRTPLVFRGPGVPAAVRVPAAVENVDVVPTVLEVLEVPAPDRLQGSSLVATWNGEEGTAIAFALQFPWASVDDGRFKLMVDLDSGTRRLFELETDPGESVDAASEHPEAVARLEGPLHDWIEHEVDAVRDRPALADSLDQLRALGYLP